MSNSDNREIPRSLELILKIPVFFALTAAITSIAIQLTIDTWRAILK